MSWGYKVTFITLGFVLFMTFMVIKASHQTYDLVAEDYYGKELQFQKQIDKQKNQEQLKERIKLAVADGNVIMTFPEVAIGSQVQGNVLFFRPSDAKKDVKSSIQLTSAGQQVFPGKAFSKGLYRVQVDYTMAGKEYYTEETLIIE